MQYAVYILYWGNCTKLKSHQQLFSPNIIDRLIKVCVGPTVLGDS